MKQTKEVEVLEGETNLECDGKKQSGKRDCFLKFIQTTDSVLVTQTVNSHDTLCISAWRLGLMLIAYRKIFA